MTLDDTSNEYRAEVVDAVLARPFHRGDRVIRTADGVPGIVDGWKGDRVLVLFAVDAGRGVREWHDVSELAVDTSRPRPSPHPTPARERPPGSTPPPAP